MKFFCFRHLFLIASLLSSAGLLRSQPEVAGLELIAPFGLFDNEGSMSYSEVAGLNNSGQLVVTANDSAGAGHAFVWTTGGVTEISNTLPGASGAVNVAGINDSGQIVGMVGSLGPAYVWSEGVMTEIVNSSGSGDFFPQAINNSGQVVGTVGGFSGSTSFKWTGAGMVEFGVEGGSDIVARAINNSGQTAGWAYDSVAGHYRALRWDNDGNVSVITAPEANVSAFAYGINDNGLVVGSFSSADHFGTDHAFLWDGTAAIDLGTLLASGFQSSVAYGVNNLGQVVGIAYGAFLYSDGVLLNLNDLAASLLTEAGTTSGFVSLDSAYDINDLGQIIGSGTYYDSVTDTTYIMGFMLSLATIPEPSACAALAGFAALGTIVFRRRRCLPADASRIVVVQNPRPCATQ